jgi:hypothetical protein
MRRETRKFLTYGALALGAYSIFKAANQPAIASTAGLGDLNPGSIMWGTPGYNDPPVDPGSIMQVHPGGNHPAHPYWRWWRGAPDANQSTFASPYSGNPWQYNPWQNYWGGGSTFGGGYLDYNAEEYEQPGSLAARSAEYT